MERRYQCSICILLCDGDGIPGLRQPENTCICWLLLWWCLVCSCTMSARTPSGFSKRAEQICLIHLAGSDLFIITFLAMLLLIQQNDQQRIKGYSFQLYVKAEKHQDEVDQSGLLDSCVSFWLPGAASFCQKYVFAVLSSNENCNFQWSAFCVELIYATTYREILQFS